MNRKPKDIEPHLLQWQHRYNDWQAQYEALRTLTQCGPEAPIATAMGLMWDAYTDCLAREVGDTADWLSWYCWENGMGTKGLEATGADGKTIRVRTAAHLARVICAPGTQC